MGLVDGKGTTKYFLTKVSITASFSSLIVQLARLIPSWHEPRIILTFSIHEKFYSLKNTLSMVISTGAQFNWCFNWSLKIHACTLMITIYNKLKVKEYN